MINKKVEDKSKLQTKGPTFQGGVVLHTDEWHRLNYEQAGLMMARAELEKIIPGGEAWVAEDSDGVERQFK